ncbi:MAG: cytochrome c biogenesis protein CcdA [Patescibacteria group bacterium]
MNKKLITLAVIGILLLTAILFFKGSSTGAATLWSWSNGGTWLLPLVGVAALMDSINPCAFSILILTIAFLFSIGKLRSDILKIGGIYILGIFLIYLAIGLGILQTLHLFNTPHFMAKVGATLLVAMGLLSVIGHLFPNFPIKLKIPHASHARIAELMEKASMPAAFILGGLVGLCEFPCTGGPYLLVLGLLHDQATYLRGLGYLLFYNAIFVLPLVIILLISGNTALLEKVKTWKQANTGVMRLWGGIAMILLGLIIFII